MNPFDLSGPSFLIFYWTLSLVCVLSVFWLRLGTDVTGGPAHMTPDPYLISYLRADYPEAVRVALLSLIDEGVVVVKDRELSLAPPPAGAREISRKARPPIEREIISLLVRPGTIEQIVNRRVGAVACREYQEKLEDFGFMTPRARLARLRVVSVGSAVLLAAFAAIKMTVALARGRHNLGFLLFSAVVAVGLTIGIGRVSSKITTRGEQALRAAKALLQGARERFTDANGVLSGPELAWIAAAFGFATFETSPGSFVFWPALAFPWGTNYRQEPPRTSGYVGSSSSSCSTSVSSCGGGGGSSCGGGGCGGGGCGGCGGGG